MRSSGSRWSAHSAIADANYAFTTKLVLGADRLRPWLGFAWPPVSGANPPADVLTHFTRYEAMAFAMRLRSRQLQAHAFGVRAGELDDYVQAHVIAAR